jgi:cytoskeletal protein CcmA (bactofilin family)
MFRTKHGFGGWWPGLNFFISYLQPRVHANISMWNSPKCEVLDSTKADLMNLPVAYSRLGPSLRVKGEISGDGDLLVDGSVEGVVRLDKGKLMIGPTAKLEAEITADEVLVRGNVKGNVRAGQIEVGSDGSVIGDLTARQVFIKDGAHIKRSIRIEKSTEEIGDTLPEVESAPRKIAAAAGAGKM